MGVEMNVQKIQSPGTSSLVFRRFHADEALSLRVEGALVDPRLLSLTLGGTVGGFQERFSTAGLIQRTQSDLLGYDTTATFLREKPVVLSLFANRHDGTSTRSFGGFSETLTENIGGSLLFRYKALPSTVGLRREFSRESFQLGETIDRREELRTIASYDGSSNWETGGLNLRYDWTKNNDRVFPAGDFRTNMASASLRQGFGTDLQPSMDLRASYFDRSGSTSLSSFLSDALLKIAPSDTVTTSLQYLFNRIQVKDFRAERHTGELVLDHHLFESLVSTVRLGGSVQTQPDGNQEEYRAQIQEDYKKKIPWNGTLAATASTSLQIEDRNLADAVGSIIGEAHIVNGFAPFFLGQPDVVVSTLVLSDPTRATIYRKGFDYDVRVSGILLEIDRLPGGLWIDGQTILADYQTSIPNALAFSRRSTRGGASLDFKWIILSYNREVIVEDLLSGRDLGFLEDTLRDEGRVQLRLDLPTLTAQASQKYVNYDSRRLAYRAWELNQFVSWRVNGRFFLYGSLGEQFYHYRTPERTTSSYSGTLDLDWRPIPALSVDPFLAFSALADSDAPNQRMEDGGVRARFTYGKMELSGRGEVILHRQGENRTDEIRITLNATRRF